jgi:hypothetical protein
MIGGDVESCSRVNGPMLYRYMSIGVSEAMRVVVVVVVIIVAVAVGWSPGPHLFAM